jgi:hypothetical protein
VTGGRESAVTDIRVVSTAAAVPREWDDLAGPGECYPTRKFLRVSEATSGVLTRYLLSEQDGHLNGGLATALALPTSPWLYGRTDTVLEFKAGEGMPGAAECLAALAGEQAVPRTVGEVTRALAEGSPHAPVTDALMPSLVCGGRHVSRVRVLSRDAGEAGYAGEAVVGGLVRHAEGVARELGARSVAFLYVGEHDTRVRHVLAGLGYLGCESGSYSDLLLPDGGLDGYRAMLPRKRRPVIAAERRKLAAAGVKIGIEPLSDGHIGLLADLESQLFTRHGGSWSPRQSAEVFEAVQAEFGRDAMVALAWMDGTPCGFALILQHGQDWSIHRVGLDYERIGDLPVYFEVAFNSVIEHAPSFGVRTVHYGLGATRAKQLRGCTVTRTVLYCKAL